MVLFQTLNKLNSNYTMRKDKLCKFYKLRGIFLLSTILLQLIMHISGYRKIQHLKLNESGQNRPGKVIHMEKTSRATKVENLHTVLKKLMGAAIF